MSNQKDPASLIMAVATTFIVIFACLIVAAVFNIGREVEQNPGSHWLPPSPQKSQ